MKVQFSQSKYFCVRFMLFAFINSYRNEVLDILEFSYIAQFDNCRSIDSIFYFRCAYWRPVGGQLQPPICRAYHLLPEMWRPFCLCPAGMFSKASSLLRSFSYGYFGRRPILSQRSHGAFTASCSKSTVEVLVE